MAAKVNMYKSMSLLTETGNQTENHLALSYNFYNLLFFEITKLQKRLKDKTIQPQTKGTVLSK